MKTWLIPVMLLIGVMAAHAVAEGKRVKQMEITSRSFTEGGTIPARYTCDGDDVNPSLTIGTVPEKAQSLALIMDDPDAPVGTWVHWVVWNMTPAHGVIQENSAPEGAVQGRNSWGKNRYGGPCPPSGSHRYFFKLFALDTLLTLPASADKGLLEKAMHGHILAEAQCMGTYKRR
jgi:Raf kinase inhibitor-like YbhB/YbcL family protein